MHHNYLFTFVISFFSYFSLLSCFLFFNWLFEAFSVLSRGANYIKPSIMFLLALLFLYEPHSSKKRKCDVCVHRVFYLMPESIQRAIMRLAVLFMEQKKHIINANIRQYHA